MSAINRKLHSYLEEFSDEEPIQDVAPHTDELPQGLVCCKIEVIIDGKNGSGSGFI